MVEIRKIQNIDGKKLDDEQINNIVNELTYTLIQCGFRPYVFKVNGSKIRISEIRLNVNLWSHNRNTSTARRANILSWAQWIIVNNLINAIFDKLKLSAKISSLSGQFIIRDGKNAVKFWDNKGCENISRVMSPIDRIHAYQVHCNEDKYQYMLNICAEKIKQLEA